MADSFVVGAYWGSRSEMPEGCAQRLNQLLAGLKSLDPVFAGWFAKGPSAGIDRTKNLSPADINDLAMRGVNRRDLGASPIPALGVRIGVWNGGREGTTAVGISTRCGSFDESGGVPALNSLLISLPNQGPDADRILNIEALEEMLEVVVRAYDPDWAVVASREHMKLWPSGPEGGPHAGWITYLSRRNREATLAANGLALKRLEFAAFGTAWVTTEERFSLSNPTHIAQGRVLEQAISRRP